jgi:uncharacterized protein (TIGR00730 family)
VSPDLGRTHVAVFCGSSSGRRPEYAEAARQVGRELGRRGLTLVYGGGAVGLMNEVATSCLAAGGKAIGVIPRALVARELEHKGLTELHETDSMHERKQLMADLAHAFIGLPGGYGTLDEMFEALTWAQLGIHEKPIAFLDVQGFYKPLVAALDTMAAEGFTSAAHRMLVHVESDPARLVEWALTHQPAASGVRWVTERER